MVVTKFIYKEGSSGTKHNARCSHTKLFDRINFPDSRYSHRLWPCAKTSLFHIIFYEPCFVSLRKGKIGMKNRAPSGEYGKRTEPE